MKIEIKKLANLTGNIFKFNMRNKKYWVFVYLLIALSAFCILLGSIVTSVAAKFDSSLVLMIIPYFNLFSGVFLSLVFIMFAATPMFRDKDLALFDLEKRYGYKPWEIICSRFIWIFTMCISVWLFIFIISLIGGSFGAVGSKMIYVKSFVMPSVWNLYLLFLVPLLTLFISLVFGAMFGKMILYFATILVAFSPVISNFVQTFTQDLSSSGTDVDGNFTHKGQLTSALLVEKYFQDSLNELDEKDEFKVMLKEYANFSKDFVPGEYESKSNDGDQYRQGIPYIKDKFDTKDYQSINDFYEEIIKVLPKYTVIKSASDENEYDPSVLNDYLSKVKQGKYKNTVRILKETFNEWKLITNLDYGDIQWYNTGTYKLISQNKKAYDNSLEVAVLNASLFTVLHQYAQKANMYGDFEPIEVSNELLAKSKKVNAFTFLMNPLNTWDMLFSAPIQSRANLLLQANDYSGKTPFHLLNVDFKMVDGKPVVYDILPIELIIIFNFLVMVVLYAVGYLLWKRQILK